MDIEVRAPKSIILPGQDLWLRVSHEGPFTAVQPGDTMIVQTSIRDCTTYKKKNEFKTTNTVIDETWVVHSRDGRYFQFPRAVLTHRRPTTSWSSTSIAVAISTLAGFAGLCLMGLL